MSLIQHWPPPSELEQLGERARFGPGRRAALWVAEMAEHHRHAERAEQWCEVAGLIEIDQHLDMPAVRRDALCHATQHVGRHLVLVGSHIDHVEAQAAHAGSMQRFDFAFRNVRRCHRNGAEARSAILERVEHRRVVGAIYARLHQHSAFTAQRLEQFLVVAKVRIRRRVNALLRIRKPRLEDMRVSIAGERRKRRARRARLAVRWRAQRRIVRNGGAHVTRLSRRKS